MDHDLLAADEELVEVWYGIDSPDDAPDLVEEEEDVGEMEIGDDAVEFEEALC